MNITEYDRVTVLTGAGISAPSGLATFRGDESSLWNSDQLIELGTIGYAVNHTDQYWRTWGAFRTQCANVEPNAAHYALAEWQKAKPEGFTLITQNVDGLHQRAGSTDVIELHGTLYMNKCRDRACPQEPWEDREARTRAPRCPVCQTPVLPAMTFFGEYVDAKLLARSNKAAKTCDLYVVVGSSGVVPPASNFAFIAKQRNAHTVLINSQPWEYMDHFDEVMIAPSEQVLPELVAQFGG